jgi:hypothetical protein
MVVTRRAELPCKDLGSTLSLYHRSHDVEGQSSLHLALIFQSVAGAAAAEQTTRSS